MFKSMKMTGGAAVALICLGAGQMAFAQVTSINSARAFPREFNDDPTSNFTSTLTYPSLIQFSDQSVDNNGATGGFANRHVWRFSNNANPSGTTGTAFAFTNDSFFDVSMSVTLSGNNSPHKEAGYLFDTIGGQGQFIVNSDAGEIVAFGGPLPFYSFNTSSGLSYTAGSTITLGMSYFLDPSDNRRKIIYRAGSVSSPALVFDNLEQGIINNTTLGGYLQTTINLNNPNNGAQATFGRISITDSNVIPEPSSLLLLGIAGAGGLAVRARQRRRASS